MIAYKIVTVCALSLVAWRRSSSSRVSTTSRCPALRQKYAARQPTRRYNGKHGPPARICRRIAASEHTKRDLSAAAARIRRPTSEQLPIRIVRAEIDENTMSNS